MKIFFRYLFVELLKPFLFCLVATSALGIILDLSSTLADFVSAGTSVPALLAYYGAQVPKMLEFTIPISLLFASLYVILTMSRRSELLAFQAGGMGPLVMFSPFIVMAAIAMVVHFVMISWPGTQSEAIRERTLKELGTDNSQRNIRYNVIYWDSEKHRFWYVRYLNLASAVQAIDVEILQRRADGSDVEKYFARSAAFENGRWKLINVMQFIYGPNGDVVDQKRHGELPMPTMNIPPQVLAYVTAEPSQMTLTQLWNYLEEFQGKKKPERMAPYATQFWYLIAYPSMVMIMLLFAIAMGNVHDRRVGVAGGVFASIFVLVTFYVVEALVHRLGEGNRLPPMVAGFATPVLFGAAAMLMVAWKFGWLWQVAQWCRQYQSRLATPEGTGVPQDMMPASVRDLRLRSLKLLLDKVTKQSPLYREEPKDKGG
jgi:lipopolysaccharide export system permease protein